LRQLGEALGMAVLVGEPSEPESIMRTAILTRLPVRSWRNERHRGRMLRSNLHCELETGSSTVPVLSVHCVHFAARFGERANGEARRIRELGALLEDIERGPAMPHVIAGDFNALSPGDNLEATAFFRLYNRMRRAGLVVEGQNGYLMRRPRNGSNDAEVDAAWLEFGIDPRLDMGIPSLPKVVSRLTRGMPAHTTLDRFLGRFLERWTMERLAQAGYIDVFRRIHPRARGYTCATWLPAARVDYVFASPELAPHAVDCGVVGSRPWPDPDAWNASDHFPLVADFAL
ncbi:MAG TPA: endonuclease/exonuclease/phosphatase family protein, partial [Candidatus Dormibacteraeota bacterium]|nr:endonuclease/exonuclease/phosphatase family protein [Candidatus Dormibacteraeota bacterium]